MWPRIAALLLVAVVSGLVAGFVGQATAGKTRAATRPPRIVYGPCPIPSHFRPGFEQASIETQLPLALLAAVANVESRFEPDARSAAGAHGLLQVLPQNVRAGARYLRMLLDRFQSTELALAAYNAGPTAVQKAGGAPNRASLTYIREVTRLWRSLNGCK